MTPEQAISLYMQLTGDIHAYWVAFGAVAVLIVGWLLSRKVKLELTRFRGHPIVGAERSVHDAEESPAVSAGLPTADR